jgi:hypothetical protein
MIIVFTSQDVYKEKRYFVGFYVGDYLKYDEEDDNRIYRHKNDIFNVMFPKYLSDHIKNNGEANSEFDNYNNGRYINFKIIKNIRGVKCCSTVFDNPIPLDIEIKWQRKLWVYNLDEDPELLYDLLQRALNENSHNEVIKDKILRLMDKYDKNNNLFLP